MKNKCGFSLLEITVVMFVMGLTITALLQMFDWSHTRYRETAKGWQERAFLSEIRIWLRERITMADTDSINIKTLGEAIKLPDSLRLSEVKLTNYDHTTYFVRVGYFDDKNRNGKADKLEAASRLFCFRKRSA